MAASFLYLIFIFHAIHSLPKRSLDLIAFTLRFYPILHIAAITADITDDRDLGINIVSAGVAVLVIGNTDNILRAAFRTVFCIFHGTISSL